MLDECGGDFEEALRKVLGGVTEKSYPDWGVGMGAKLHGPRERPPDTPLVGDPLRPKERRPKDGVPQEKE